MEQVSNEQAGVKTALLRVSPDMELNTSTVVIGSGHIINFGVEKGFQTSSWPSVYGSYGIRIVCGLENLIVQRTIITRTPSSCSY